MSDAYENTIIIMDSSYSINKNTTRKAGVTPVTICCKGTAAEQIHSDLARAIQFSYTAQPDRPW